MAAQLTMVATYAAGGAAAVGAWLTRVKPRLELSGAKHKSLAGHVRMAKRVAGLIPFYEYDEARFFCCDDAPAAVAEQRRAAFERLAALYGERFAKTRALTGEAAGALSDLQFTSLYRVPFQFSRMVRQHLSAGAFVADSSGVTVSDCDGNVFYDLTGSYGVNLFGNDFYKDCIASGAARVAALGPVLGPYHPVVAENVARLLALSGQDEVSFHMSGTEAVMQAVRLARYHTGRSHLVRFSGAYHGWWGDVQPGLGNPTPADRTYTLAEMSEQTLRVLRRRRNIACVLVNPLQGLHPNGGAPAESSLVANRDGARFDRDAYTAWLRDLRAVCDQRGIALIFDEVFMGFRLARGGAQDYFGVRADLVTYGKTLGGGLPIGVLCGRHALMKRFRDDRPADVCFARGTFNSHPYVMGAMDAFLRRIDEPDIASLYDNLDAVWERRAAAMNHALAEADLPLRVAHMSSVWTVCHTKPSRYNWMLQYYLRAEGIALSWVGTGRLIFSLNYSDVDFDAVVARFVAAGRSMEEDGWWWVAPGATSRSVKRAVLREMLSVRLLGRPRREPVLPR